MGGALGVRTAPSGEEGSQLAEETEMGTTTQGPGEARCREGRGLNKAGRTLGVSGAAPPRVRVRVRVHACAGGVLAEPLPCSPAPRRLLTSSDPGQQTRSGVISVSQESGKISTKYYQLDLGKTGVTGDSGDSSFGRVTGTEVELYWG